MKTTSRPKYLRTLIESLLPALVTAAGLQLLRSLIPGLVWYLRDTRGASTLGLIPYAFGTFFLGFLAPLLARLLGKKPALWLTAGGTALVRVCEQFIHDPGLDFYLAMAGVGLFLNFLPLAISWHQEEVRPGPAAWASGLVLGFALDTTLRGIFGFRDLSTVAGWLSAVLVCLLAAGILWCLVRQSGTGTARFGEGRGRESVLLLAIGPYFVLQLLFLGSPGWLEEVSGLGFPAGFLLVGLGYAAAAAGLGLGLARPLRLHPSLAAAVGLVLTYSIYYADQLGPAAIALLLVGQLALGWGLGAISCASRQASRSTIWRTTLAVNGGMVIFLILAFAYYAALDIALPISRASFPALAAGLAAGAAVWAGFQIRSLPDCRAEYSTALAAGGLLLVPLACWAAWSGSPAVAGNGDYPIKVMNYNIHSAFNTGGSQDLEAIAQVIEESGADVVTIQEISRTRLMDGGADMPTWLARRLGMTYIFHGTEEPTWGNALLSRYPILDSGYAPLPREGTLMGRGYLWALLDLGEAEPLLVIATHLHHLEDEGAVREVQVPVLLEFWNGRGRTVLLGDFNAEPGSPEMELIAAAGMVDAWSQAGLGPGFTWPASDPYQRIDWIWLSPDLQALQAEAMQTGASDHLPVLAEVSP